MRRVLANWSLGRRSLALAALLPVAAIITHAWSPPLALLAGILALTAASPSAGLFAVALLVPLEVAIATLLTGAGAIWFAESLVLAFLAGWLANRVLAARSDAPNLGRIAAPLWICGGVVAASFAVSVMNDPVPGRTWAEVIESIRVIAREYFFGRSYETTGAGGTGMLIEGLLLVPAVVALARARPALAERLARLMTVTAVLCACFSVFRLGQLLMAQATGWRSIRTLVTTNRLSYFVADLNAAGSYFALFLCVAAALAIGSRRWTRIAWTAGALMLLAGLWISGSRAALGAAGVVGAWRLVAYSRARGWPMLRTAALLTAAIGLAVVAVWWFLPTWLWNRDSLAADKLGLLSLEFRWWFLATALNMWGTAPFFGAGVGRFYALSPNFLHPQLAISYPAENAHNNFVQIGAEAGIIGLLAFLWLLYSVARAALRAGEAARTPAFNGIVAGLAVFLLTCLAGHPLLVRPVSYAFWLTVGVVAAMALRSGAEPQPESGPAGGGAGMRRLRTARSWLVPVALLALAVSVPIRVRDQATRPGATFGLFPPEVEPQTGRQYRWSRERSRLCVKPEGSRLVLSLRASPPDPRGEILGVEVSVNGRPFMRTRPPSDAWERLVIDLPLAARGQRSCQIDLTVSKAERTPLDRGYGIMVSVTEGP